MLHKLIFDTTSAATIADSHSVGAYLRASDGTLLTHTDVGGKKALDVRIAEGINVEVDLSHVDDSVKIGDGTEFLAINGDGSINAVVTAINLDIRDLAFSTDSVNVSGSAVTVSNTVAVSATDLDIRNLVFTSDSVDVSGSSVAISGGSVTVNDAALANTAVKATANTLGVIDTAEDVVAIPLANRKYLYIYNNDNRILYIGENGVTAANGFPIPPGAMLDLRCGTAIDLEWVSNKAGHDMRTLELS